MTELVCVSTVYSFMPVVFILSRKRKEQEFQLGLPPGGLAEVSDTGWMNNERFFFEWLKKLAQYSKSIKNCLFSS